MRNIFKSLLFATALLAFSSCDDSLSDDWQLSTEPRGLTLVNYNLKFGSYTDLTQTLTLKSQNTPWKLTGLPDWLTANPVQGTANDTVITFTATENTSFIDKREATFTFVSAVEDFHIEQPIYATQDIAKIYITPSVTEVTLAPIGETQTLTVKSNVEWTATFNANWATVTKVSSGQLQISAGMNLDLNRSLTINLRDKSTNTSFATITVEQWPMIYLSPSELTFDATGGTSNTFSILTDYEYTVTPSASWLTYNRVDKSFTVTATANTGDTAREATITVALTGLPAGVSVEKVVTVKQRDLFSETLGICPDGHHPHAIDMGGGVKFACCDVGVTSPTGYGSRFAWAETSTKTSYTWSNYRYCASTYDTLTKYCTSDWYGNPDGVTSLQLSDDAAYSRWGSSWRMPSKDKLTVLNDNCTWTWTTLNDVNGYMVTATNGNSIFLPYSGSYWSSTLEKESPHCAYVIYCTPTEHIVKSVGRYEGNRVRPVAY